MDIELRSITWLGDSRKQIRTMPDEVQDVIGWQLQEVQAGLTPNLAKPFKGVGSGVFEIRARFDGDTFRAVYAVQIGEEIYILHCFQKKAKKGIATPQKDVNLIKQRYKEALATEKEKNNGDNKEKNKKRH